jgi:hypothetical protein
MLNKEVGDQDDGWGICRRIWRLLEAENDFLLLEQDVVTVIDCLIIIVWLISFSVIL